MISMYIKKHETGRNPSQRNIKGKGGTARAKQLKKQLQMLRKKLKRDDMLS